MKLFSTVVFLFLVSSVAFTQEITREQRLKQIIDLNEQVRTLEGEFLLPTAADVRQAKAEGLEAVRLMPRESFDHKMIVQGGGSYFSFTTGSHDYQKIAQIGLEQNNLKVGFAGADYGFIADLGTVSLNAVNDETAEVAFLANYRPPSNLSEIRKEQTKAHKYETESGIFSDRAKAVLAHTYVLRSISFDQADILVAFTTLRKDSDGSLIIFWRLLQNFDKPTFVRDKAEN